MIRTLRLSDVPRQVLTGGPRGPDLVYTRNGSTSGVTRLFLTHMVQDGFASHRRQRAFALVGGLRLLAVATVRSRSGPRAWDLTHIRLSPEAWDRCPDLLEHCSAYAAMHGAERLFLTVPDESPLLAVAHRSGFFRTLTEVMLQGWGAATPPGQDAAGLRPRVTEDEHPLFRLYNAATPPQVRSAYGLTLEQWRDAQESLEGRSQEYVWEHEGKLVAMVRMSRHGHTVTTEAMMHPEAEWVMPRLVDFVRREAGPKGMVVWLTPEEQPAAACALKDAGFLESSRFIIMVKATAQRVHKAELAPASI